MYRNFDEMLSAAKNATRKTIAVAAAADDTIIHLVKEINAHDLCNVILAGDEALIRQIAADEDTDLTGVEIINEPDPVKSALAAVSCVSSGKADVFVKGKINTSDFLRAVLNKECGLRSGRRLSALSCYDVPSMNKLFFMTDGGMNIAPDLATKADILRNAVDTLHAFGISNPKVAILSANERVSPDMQSSVDADELCKMAASGELPEAIYEGPMAFDVIMRPEAAKKKGIESRVSGDVDLILVPNIDTGNALGKAIGFFGNGKSAVLMVGAKKPVVMASRSAPVTGKLMTVALAILACDK